MQLPRSHFPHHGRHRRSTVFRGLRRKDTAGARTFSYFDSSLQFPSFPGPTASSWPHHTNSRRSPSLLTCSSQGGGGARSVELVSRQRLRHLDECMQISKRVLAVNTRLSRFGWVSQSKKLKSRCRQADSAVDIWTVPPLTSHRASAGDTVPVGPVEEHPMEPQLLKDQEGLICARRTISEVQPERARKVEGGERRSPLEWFTLWRDYSG
jgi:hypothetical protein